MIDGHGDDAHRFGGKDIVRYNFSSNIAAGLDHTQLWQYLATCLPCISSYPPPAPTDLEKRIAAMHGIDTSEVMVTNGATEAIYMLAQSMQGASSAIMMPTFSEYRDACIIHNHRITTINSLSAIVNTDAAWICNPNNPTGDVYSAENVTDFARQNASTTLILDHSYDALTDEPVISVNSAIRSPQIVIIHSLTKRFAVPGLRIGYITAHRNIIGPLKRMRRPWAIGAIEIAAATYLIDHADDYRIDRCAIHNEASRVASMLTAAGIEVHPSSTNFMLCRLPKGTAADLKLHLLKRHNMLIRDASNFEGLTPAHFRIAIIDRKADDLLIKAIASWTASLD